MKLFQLFRNGDIQISETIFGIEGVVPVVLGKKILKGETADDTGGKQNRRQKGNHQPLEDINFSHLPADGKDRFGK